MYFALIAFSNIFIVSIIAQGANFCHSRRCFSECCLWENTGPGDTLRFLLVPCICYPPFAKTRRWLKQFARWRKSTRNSQRNPRYRHQNLYFPTVPQSSKHLSHITGAYIFPLYRNLLSFSLILPEPLFSTLQPFSVVLFSIQECRLQTAPIKYGRFLFVQRR